MRLTVLGSGAACAGNGGNSSGYLVEDSGLRILLDCGHGVASTLVSRCPPVTIDHIFISHMHADHFIDLLPLRFAVTRDMDGLPQPCGRLHLPPGGGESLERLLEAVCFPANFFSSVWQVSEYQPGSTHDLGCSVSARLAGGIHYVPGWAIRIDGSASLTYTGDTAPSDDIRDLAAGSDLLLAEATLDEPECGPVRGHLTAHQAAELAASAGVQSLMLTHFWYDADRDAAGREARKWLEAEVLVASDGAVVEL
ncbi:MAG: MBL fold metallo-hydrolase [Chloroflexi bacterium]|nr:MBL fold metallo-hydrolase [Chloroflexota bacterium]MCY3696305.1 MBL fold metallo-hydrolase [Chloroflexota bacterium]MXX31130.1 MBL fold metallo-hydrolase [Chloroflexota bacterium]MYB23347.1 MBL fold metallo-hydrolase [Chloroflexota bacterium]MYD16861.1 MBL fold metallo-hydrolase [Chloroflexota bacterium]